MMKVTIRKDASQINLTKMEYILMNYKHLPDNDSVADSIEQKFK
jgi:hypothetical protein